MVFSGKGHKFQPIRSKKALFLASDDQYNRYKSVESRSCSGIQTNSQFKFTGSSWLRGGLRSPPAKPIRANKRILIYHVANK